LLAPLLIAGFPKPADGQTSQTIPCTDRSVFITHLTEKYQEESIGVGLTHAGTVLEVLTSMDGSTWTVLVTGTNGKSCMIASGTGWIIRGITGIKS